VGTCLGQAAGDSGVLHTGVASGDARAQPIVPTIVKSRQFTIRLGGDGSSGRGRGRGAYYPYSPGAF